MSAVTATHEAGESGEHAEAGKHGEAGSTGISNAKLGMWVFLASECLLFGGLIATYLLYSDQVGAEDLGPQTLFDIPFTSVTSFVLLMSSLTMVLALSAIQRAEYRRFKIWILATAFLGALFIACQVYEFTVFYNEGLGYTTNLFGSAFYTLTGFHGVHVSLGIVMLMTLVVLHSRGRLQSGDSETVEIVGLYWHFVDIVWILIFTVVYLFPQ
jgi:heme/copper-type cytochrome/quinol oxidase subunit 3